MEFLSISDSSLLMVLSYLTLQKCTIDLTEFNAFLSHVSLQYHSFLFILIFTITNSIFTYVFACKYNLSFSIITDMLGHHVHKGFLTLKKVCLLLQDEVRCNDQHTIIRRRAVFLRNLVLLSFKKEIKRAQYICFNAQIRSSVLSWILFP